MKNRKQQFRKIDQVLKFRKQRGWPRAFWKTKIKDEKFLLPLPCPFLFLTFFTFTLVFHSSWIFWRKISKSSIYGRFSCRLANQRTKRTIWIQTYPYNNKWVFFQRGFISTYKLVSRWGMSHEGDEWCSLQNLGLKQQQPSPPLELWKFYTLKWIPRSFISETKWAKFSKVPLVKLELLLVIKTVLFLSRPDKMLRWNEVKGWSRRQENPGLNHSRDLPHVKTLTTLERPRGWTSAY